jgi:polyisoprenoid-binding protein YceI
MMISEVDGKFTEFDATVNGGDENFIGGNVEFSVKIQRSGSGWTWKESRIQGYGHHRSL